MLDPNPDSAKYLDPGSVNTDPKYWYNLCLLSNTGDKFYKPKKIPKQMKRSKCAFQIFYVTNYGTGYLEIQIFSITGLSTGLQIQIQGPGVNTALLILMRNLNLFKKILGILFSH
jgi:hypothetical protein